MLSYFKRNTKSYNIQHLEKTEYKYENRKLIKLLGTANSSNQINKGMAGVN